MAKRGAFIVLEGGDRCGKTTRVALLAQALANLGHPTKTLKFPDRTTATGRVLNQYLTNAVEVDDKAIHLLFAQNRREAEPSMRALLQSGTTLIADRYAYSGVAYSASKGLDLTWCQRPDRGGYGAERYESTRVQTRVRSLFLDRLRDDRNWAVVRADQSIEEVHRDVMAAVLARAIRPAVEEERVVGELWVGEVDPLDVAVELVQMGVTVHVEGGKSAEESRGCAGEKK
ncbi:thymidylate kinase [Allomyces macrogynus ATCC 38327]|uniref:Thymidylate kinase n=1 Tax=Allomyces macrogynus (strain ATCC 38327) TaxID=578462 RepID=A0A0L0S8I8_ALLM3|nr:thymidylate kinase [Allomyces macrogynus ATCC 38327]|eukprot:KNE58797.1 thymidylate kinase [Allomyces macrogynus ATCC 38327]